MKFSGPRNRRHFALAVAFGTPVLGFTTPAHALLADSYKCRKIIQKAAEDMTKKGMDFTYKCRKAQDKLGLSGAACNVITPGVAPFDPKIPPKYQKDIRDKYIAKIAEKCQAPSTSVLEGILFPAGAFATLNPLVEDAHSGNSRYVIGSADLVAGALPTAQEVLNIKCLETIAVERAKIILEVIKSSAKCQKTKDVLVTDETAFTGLDPSCVTTKAALPLPQLGPMKTPLAFAKKVQAKCTDVGVSAATIGTCSPLPDCVVDSAITTGQRIAAAQFSIQDPICGNGSLEQGEQCDDGNTTNGDGCNDVCEFETGHTCTDYPPNTIGGTRTVTISVNVPGAQKLAGLQIDLDYPQFESGITGTGQSSVVASHIAVNQAPSIPDDRVDQFNDTDNDIRLVTAASEEFIDDGNIFTVTMDGCVAKEINFCNRNQNVIGCCDAATDTDGDTVFQECVAPFDPNSPPVCALGSFPLTTVGACSVPEDGCPGDNACISQSTATFCTVSGASDKNGQPVAGVTCNVNITGF